MKRVFEHPPEPKTGKQYWRSAGELSDTPEFRSWLEKEFPAGAAEMEGDEVSRRSFLKLMGASMALAGLGLNSCRRPEAHLLPFSKSVEWAIPGKALFYATAMPRRTGALPLVVSTVDGRPIKIEGNPLHPASGGATDAFAQASILDLYDPARSQRFIEQVEREEKDEMRRSRNEHGAQVGGARKKKIVPEMRDRDAFEKYLADLRTRAGADGGAGLAFLVEETMSPTRERLRGELEKMFPRMRWAQYEPLLSEAQNFGTQISFGDNSKLVPHFERADVVLSLGADFLDCGEGDIVATRAFTARRRVSSSKDTMNRLYVVENRYTLTGAMADHRLRIPASQIPAFTHALAGKIAASTKDPGLGSVIATLTPPQGAMQFDDAWLTECANDLVSKAGASLVVAGSQQPVVVQLMVYGINAALRNIGTTLIVRDFPRNPKTNSILQLASEMNAGRIKQLFILGGDPVYNAPRALAIDPATKQALDWEELQKRVPEVIRVGYYPDATSALAKWHVPAAHYLESWGDSLTSEGGYVVIQPMILPLFGGVSEIEILTTLLGRPRVEGPEVVQETFRSTAPPGDFATAWSQLLRDGFASHIPLRDKPPTFNGNAAGGVAHTLWSSAPAPTPDAPEIVLVRSYSVDDGRYSNNGWLQEMPNPITKLTWDNAALMSPAQARHLNVETGDMIEITVTETTTGPNDQPLQRQLLIAAMIVPGHADCSISVELGYGRTLRPAGALPYAGANAADNPPAGDTVGFNGYILRTSSNPHFILADDKAVKGVQVKKAAGKHLLAVTQEHWSIEGRGLVREATLDGYRADNDFVKKIAGDEEIPPQQPTLYSHPPLNAPNQWGMAVDLNVCTGCSACVIACQAENNIPIVGKLQVTHGRAMHWMRIDRYFATRAGYNQDRGEIPGDAEIVHQPMMCQHCENAPCETVCPVNATVHSEDGLNVMAYNRCIGTRYCANNCPFKVRRFNFFDYNQRPVGKTKVAGLFNVYKEYLGPLTEKGAPDTMKLQKNPNVTVRMRGVMEKCTYCVQRIQEAKIAAKVRAGGSPNVNIPADSFTSACAQACPTEAIVFGDLANKESAVYKIKEQDRNYRLLEYLNVKTRTSYLARLRNPNPKMPDAAQIAVASLNVAHGKDVNENLHDYEDHVRGTLNPTQQPAHTEEKPGHNDH
ncbi:MAG: TAT-variant-translocated molybdopterin oxidoreductase [Verrucomicrobiota bacterium]|nr:TAT-variant-translocated molybdopterin oxidoreductase [Verrucomicrobiota bacterium]